MDTKLTDHRSVLRSRLAFLDVAVPQASAALGPDTVVLVIVPRIAIASRNVIQDGARPGATPRIARSMCVARSSAFAAPRRVSGAGLDHALQGSNARGRSNAGDEC